MGSNTVRIIGGSHRRRLLRFPDALALRPTPDRVRETVFNWLGQDLTDLDCLDLFAGSGALGFEAASRNARSVTLVDASPAVVNALQDNARQLVLPALRAVKMDALQFAARAGGRYDLVFLDPPYRQQWLARLQPYLPALLRPDARVYVEAETPLDPAEWPGFTLLKAGKAGQVCYHLLESCMPSAPENADDCPAAAPTATSTATPTASEDNAHAG